MVYYVYLNGARRGPLTEEKVRSYLADNLLHPSDLVSDRPDADWKPASAFFPELSSVKTGAVGGDCATVAASTDYQHAGTPPNEAIAPLPNEPGIPLASLGPYSRSTLAPNETPYFKTSLHWIIFARFGVLAFLVFLFAAIPFAIGVQALTGSELGWFTLPLPAFILLPPTLAFASSELVITDRRVLIKTGIVRRQSLEMFVSKIESIAVDQGFLGRVFDYGTVTVRGTGGFEEPFEGIAEPILFRNWVQRLQTRGESRL